MKEGRYQLMLFVSGMSVKSIHAINNLKKICDEHLGKDFDLQITDITKEPEMAVKFQIFAIPTLIKKGHTASRMIVGDLSDTEKVLSILNLS